MNPEKRTPKIVKNPVVIGWNVQPTSDKTQSLLQSVDEPTQRFSIVSLQMPSEVANEIKKRWDVYQNLLNAGTKLTSNS